MKMFIKDFGGPTFGSDYYTPKRRNTRYAIIVSMTGKRIINSFRVPRKCLPKGHKKGDRVYFSLEGETNGSSR